MTSNTQRQESLTSSGASSVPKVGPKPTLLSRRQIDALYDLLSAVTDGLNRLDIPYILTGGSLLGAIRQHSILFCDDDIDLAILETNGDSMYKRATSQLPSLLGTNFQYTVRPWEGGDKVRIKSCSNVFLDIFVIRRYDDIGELLDVIGVKKNGEKQSDDYVRGIVDIICKSLHSQGEADSTNTTQQQENKVVLQLPCPIYHFNTRKAVELWPKEVYRECELFPIIHSLKMGPITELSGPRMPVLLLKRAFGGDCFEVYYQSMSHGGNGKATDNNDNNISSEQRLKDDAENSQPESNPALPPLVGAGGQWIQSVKAPLSQEHYLPMQPVSRTKRRSTLHCKDVLFEYLKGQKEQEKQWLSESGVLLDENFCKTGRVYEEMTRPSRTVYMDGVFDLFHMGHLHAIEQCAALGDHVIIGVTGDKDATGYKRRPIISETDRTKIVKSLKLVDNVVCPCPLVVTNEFMNEWGIDLVVHGFADPKDKDRQREFFQVAMDAGKFQEISYYSKLSTTDIISRIQLDFEDGQNSNKSNVNDPGVQQQKNGVNPKWFGSVLAAVTNKSWYIPYNPFPLELRVAIEPSLQKARKKRDDALQAVRKATGDKLYDATLMTFNNGRYSEEGVFKFDQKQFNLREMFIISCGLPSGFDLSLLHETEGSTFKDNTLFAFARDIIHFQETYDEFVRSICAPFVAAKSEAFGESIDELYYQAFPCVRVVRPGEFSIGPHADSAYGHHPCSINFYLPLTQIGGSASLFLESHPGSEDWHPIEGSYGIVKHFAGAICAHWTPENHGDFTRVSLDFRIIPGSMFHALKCGGSQPGGVRDVYRQREGYYCRCFLEKDDWVRDGKLPTPDARFGFPWTKIMTVKK